MNRTLLALMIVLCSVASAQVEVVYPYNPDANADSAITSSDLLEFLPVFASEFAPQPIYVEGMSLEEFLTYLEASLLEAQTSTDSLQALCDLLQLNLDSLHSDLNNLQGTLDSLLLDNNATSPCEDVDTDGVCDHADACIGVSVTFEYSDPFGFGPTPSTPPQVSHCMEPEGEYGFFQLHDLHIQGGYLPDLLMQYTSMSNVTFSNCDLSGLQTWGNFYDVEFISSDISNGSCTFYMGQGGSFAGSNLSHTDFLYGQFSNVDFSGANLTGASFSTLGFNSTTDFTDADFTDATFSCLSGESPILPYGYIWVPDTTCMYNGTGPIPDRFTIVPE